MPTKLDVFLAIGVCPDSTASDLANRMGKKANSYISIYKLAESLEKEGLVRNSKGRFSLNKTEEAKLLFWLLSFCFKNGIDYNTIISERTAEFARIGLAKEIRGLPFDAKTVKKVSTVLSRHGFAIIESRKPFVCRIVHSIFLERLCQFFNKKAKINCKSIADCLNGEKLDSQLEKEFAGFKRLSKAGLEFDEIGFIHSSLSLEGNTLTLPETERLIKQNIAPASKPFKEAQQVLDYKKALDNFAYSDKELNLENVLEFHRTAMNSMPSGAGQVRKQNVQIKGNPNFKTPDWKQLPQHLENFFEKVMAFERQKKLKAREIVENAAFLHNEFQRIHPFVDGNSRTSRAIFTKYLIEKGFPLTKIPVGFSEQYAQLTKLSKKRDDPKFTLLMKQITLENLKQAKQKIEFSS